jgi:hypothetical protein
VRSRCRGGPPTCITTTDSAGPQDSVEEVTGGDQDVVAPEGTDAAGTKMRVTRPAHNGNERAADRDSRQQAGEGELSDTPAPRPTPKRRSQQRATTSPRGASQDRAGDHVVTRPVAARTAVVPPRRCAVIVETSRGRGKQRRWRAMTGFVRRVSADLHPITDERRHLPEAPTPAEANGRTTGPS